jgi:hypothetical protein
LNWVADHDLSLDAFISGEKPSLNETGDSSSTGNAFNHKSMNTIFSSASILGNGSLEESEYISDNRKKWLKPVGIGVSRIGKRIINAVESDDQLVQEGI